MNEFVLTAENYHSVEANLSYLDCSTYKNVVGTTGMKGCECRGVAIAKGEWKRPDTTALMVGKYVDAYFDDSLDRFKEENPDLFTKGGELKAPYKQAEIMIDRALKDDLFMRYMQGDSQQIFTGQISNIPFRIKVDSFDGKRITDLKTCKSISETYYAKDLGERLDFCTYFGYIEQGAAYVEIVYQATGIRYPFYIAAITKEKEDGIPHPRLAVIQIPDRLLQEKMIELEHNVPKVWALLQGEIDPIPCQTCAWCADNLPLDRVISADELLLDI